MESFSLNSALENKANVSRETFVQLNLSLYQKTEWQKTEYLPSTEAGICHEFLYVPRETFFYLVSRGLEMDNVHYCKDVEST